MFLLQFEWEHLNLRTFNLHFVVIVPRLTCIQGFIFLVTWNRMCAGTHIPGSVCDNQERDLKAQPTGEALGWLQTSNIPCDKELLASFICKLEPAYS